jgi:hypothetical protein
VTTFRTFRTACTTLVACVFCAACPGETAAPSLLEAAITRRDDTVRFQAPVVVYRCDSTADLLLEGARAGNGVLVWLRVRDSLARELPIVGVRDTITRPAAVVAVRYSSQQVLHTLSLDSGRVTVHDSGGARHVAVAGSGTELQFGVRSGIAASFTQVRREPDSTASCVPAPSSAPTVRP